MKVSITKRTRKRLIIFIALLLVVAGGVLWYRCSLPRRMRLVARYPVAGGQDWVTQSGVISTAKTRVNPARPAVIALNDWQGRQQWRLTLPSEYRNISISPDGRQVTGLFSSAQDRSGAWIQHWVDGKPSWKRTVRVGEPIDIFTLDNGEVFCWEGSKLSVIKDGHVVAVNPELPLGVIHKVTGVYADQTHFRLAPDGMTLIGARSNSPLPGIHIGSALFRSLPGVEVQVLQRRGRQITISKCYSSPSGSSSGFIWPPYKYFLDGVVIDDTGTILTTTGNRHLPRHWRLYARDVRFGYFGVPQTQDLRVQQAIGLSRSTGNSEKHCLFFPKTGKQWMLPTDGSVMGLCVNENGQHAAVAVYHDYKHLPATLRWLIQLSSVSSRLKRAISSRVMGRSRLYVYAASGKRKAYLPINYDGYNFSVYMERVEYGLRDFAVSPDGREVVLLVGSRERREILHYVW